MTIDHLTFWWLLALERKTKKSRSKVRIDNVNDWGHLSALRLCAHCTEEGMLIKMDMQQGGYSPADGSSLMDEFWLKVFLGPLDLIADNAHNLIRVCLFRGCSPRFVLVLPWFLGLIELFCFWVATVLDGCLG